MRQRRLSTWLGAALTLATVCVLLTGCGGARAGVPIPDGDQAAEYISNKFSAQLRNLKAEFTGVEPRKSVLTKLIRVDQTGSDGTVRAVQLGSPAARLTRSQSNRNPAEFLNTYHPAGSPVQYIELGPRYASLAPTPWVSLPYTESSGDGCIWSGQQDACEMIQSVADSIGPERRAKNAVSRPDGSVELTAEVTLNTLMANQLLVFDQSLLERINDVMRNETFNARIALDPNGKLSEIDLAGTVADSGHEVEVRMSYRLDGMPSENDLPKIPEAGQVTVLADSFAVDDFYHRLSLINAGK